MPVVFEVDQMEKNNCLWENDNCTYIALQAEISYIIYSLGKKYETTDKRERRD